MDLIVLEHKFLYESLYCVSGYFNCLSLICLGLAISVACSFVLLTCVLCKIQHCSQHMFVATYTLCCWSLFITTSKHFSGTGYKLCPVTQCVLILNQHSFNCYLLHKYGPGRNWCVQVLVVGLVWTFLKNKNRSEGDKGAELTKFSVYWCVCGPSLTFGHEFVDTNGWICFLLSS